MLQYAKKRCRDANAYTEFLVVDAEGNDQWELKDDSEIRLDVCFPGPKFESEKTITLEVGPFFFPFSV